MSAARIVVVLGSVTPPGRMHGALQGAVERSHAAGIDGAFIDLGAVAMEFADGRPLDALSESVQRAVAMVSEADGVILATPVYRGTLTGALKNFLDLLPLEALYRRPVGIVAMGASPHHFLGASSHLRDICAWFGSLITSTDVYLTSADFADGALKDSSAADLDGLFRAVASLARYTQEADEEFGPVPLAARAR